MKKKLALFGGSPVIKRNLTTYNSIGKEEINSVVKVMKTGILSKFLGTWSKDFYGGPNVQKFEKKCSKFFKVKHAITVNSWTSGLTVAMGAIGLEPGDEVIVSPWTMCATATSIIHWNAIPVFADIEKDTFCLDPNSVEKSISKYTKAIITVDIFGQSSDINALSKIAKKYKLKLISDSAQSPGTFNKRSFTGTISDIGGYSLNYHKHINTGEGGIIVTNNDYYAERMRLIRNHAEAVVEDKGEKNLTNMIGFNYRMGEIEAAIGIQQLKKLNKLVKNRQFLAQRLTNGIKKLEGISAPKIRKDCTHAYYIYPLIINYKLIGVSRENIFSALQKEGVQGLIKGYTNLHLLPMYQNQIAYGSKGFPWSIANRKINYRKGICPNAEKLNDEIFLGILMCLFNYSQKDIDLIIKSFKKIWLNLESLK